MPRSAIALVRLLPPSDAALTDAPLLGTFVSAAPASGEAAFAELVRRHGPMVLAVCRRVLGNPHDADDAFQATFLVLARKAGTIRGNLAGWLYAVAVRTARGVRVMRDRRRKHETLSLANGRRQAVDGLDQPSDRDLAAVIDEELAKLPDHYREAIVLCELRGLSRKQAAVELGIPEGTLSSRLAGAKRKLATLLSARGVATPALLVPLVAPAVVSAALLRAAVSATRGAASSAASAAAGAVMKGMLFDQLKAVIVAAGILLTAVCGGWAMTSVPGGDHPAHAPAPRAAEDTSASLIAQLAAPEFADREVAASRLRALGLKAEPALKSGARSEDPEVRARCEKLLIRVRKDARDALVKQFNPATDVEPDHPVWQRFKSIAGNDAASRKLFAEIIADPRRLKLLDDADHNPQQAGDLYGAELERWYSFVQNLPKQPNTGVPRPEDTPYPDAVAIMYLGSYPTSTGKAKDGWLWEGHLFIDSWSDVMKSPVGPAVKRIFAAWLPLRDNPDTRERGLAIAAEYRMIAALPFARKVLADEKDVPERRAQAALLLGILGVPDDLALLRRVAESKLANEHFIHFSVVLRGQRDLDALWGAQRFGMKKIPDDMKRAAANADIRTGNRSLADCACAAAVRLAGGKPEGMGFLWPRTAKGETINDYWFAFVTSHGFETTQARLAAHARAKEFLDKQKNEPKADPMVVKLVQQLGSAEFADREAAQMALRKLSIAAEVAIKAGLKSENPEIRGRCEKLLGEIRADARTALAKTFDPASIEDYPHPLWKRFKTITGDSRASRETFAQIIKNPNWLARLDAVEASPNTAAQQYREAMTEIGRQFRFNLKVSFEIPVWPCDRGEEVAYLLLLGSYPSTAPDLSKLLPTDARLFADGEGRIHFARGLELGLQGKILESGPKFRPEPIKAVDGTDRVFAQLLAAWLPQRTDPDTLWGGFRLAAAHGASEVLPFARRAAADKSLPVSARCYAFIPLARFGTPADRPLFEALFADETVIAVHEALDIRSTIPFGAKPVKPIGKVQARDCAAGHALLLFGQNPKDFGFMQAKDRPIKPGDRPDVTQYLITEFAFPTDDDNKLRNAAHAKVKEFLDKQKTEPPSPERGAKVWPHFKKVIGDDKASRELFDLIVKNSKNLELLEKAAAGGPDLLTLYLARRDELNKTAEHPAQPNSAPFVPVPFDEVAGWLLMGTFAGVKEDNPNRTPMLRFLDVGLGQKPLSEALGKNSLVSKPLRKVVAAWLANRGDEFFALDAGLELALRYDIAETLPLGRRVVKDYSDVKLTGSLAPAAAVLRGLGMLVVGKYGSKDDIPLLRPYFDDKARVLSTVLDSKLTEVVCTVGDVALAMAVHLRGGDPRDFDFLWPTTRNGAKVADRFSRAKIGFASNEDRVAAHKKAREWLEKQKKDEPDPAAVKLVEQLGAAEFADRESAQKSLRKLGSKVSGALEAGLKSENPEIVRRCRDLLGQLARAEFEARHWGRFAKLVGDDKASRELFDRIRSLRRNVELLDAVVTDPQSAGKLYHDRWKELNEAARIPTGPGGHQLIDAPLADVVGWMYLGTFPGAEGAFHKSFALDFLPRMPPGQTARDELRDALKDKAGSAPLRTLIGKWTAARVDYTGREFGLQVAIAYDIQEVLPAARETLTAKVKDDPYPGNTTRNVGIAMLAVGKLGTKDDLPLLERYSKDEIRCATFLHDPPPKNRVSRSFTSSDRRLRDRTPRRNCATCPPRCDCICSARIQRDSVSTGAGRTGPTPENSPRWACSTCTPSALCTTPTARPPTRRPASGSTLRSRDRPSHPRQPDSPLPSAPLLISARW